MNTIRDLQDKDQTISIDLDYRVRNGSVIILNFSVFVQVDEDWARVTDVKRAKELLHQHEGLIITELQKREVEFYDIIAS